MLSSEYAEGPGAVLLPRPDESTVVIAPPGTGPGYWAGAPSAALGDDGIYLAYRRRRPWLRNNCGTVCRRGALRDGRHDLQRRGGGGVAGAPRPGAGPRRTVAAVPELRHPRHQALADRSAG